MAGQTGRRFAAIPASDVVGNFRLMGQDESGTLAALRYLRREIFTPIVSEYGGNLVKSMGARWLVEFPSIANGIGCAIRMQEVLADHDLIKLRLVLRDNVRNGGGVRRQGRQLDDGQRRARQIQTYVVALLTRARLYH